MNPMSDEDFARYEELIKEIKQLAPVREERQRELDKVMAQIGRLCTEKYSIERRYTDVEIITRRYLRAENLKARNKNSKPVDLTAISSALTAEQAQAILTQLLKARRQAEREEEEDKESILIHKCPVCQLNYIDPQELADHTCPTNEVEE